MTKDKTAQNAPAGNEKENTAGKKDAEQGGNSEAGREKQVAGALEEGEKKGGGPCMPKPTFSTFVLSLASTALVQLGEVPDPATGAWGTDLEMARHSIDILSMLRDKTQNGLDEEEARLLEGLLYELRMKFVVIDK